MRANALRLPMAHPGDLSALDRILAKGRVRAEDIVAIIGKTEGNGGVNDFTRGYFTQSLMALLGRKLGRSPEDLIKQIPCVLSGGTEGVLSPHYVVLSRSGAAATAPLDQAALTIGTAMSPSLAAEHVGRKAHVLSVPDAVGAAMEQLKREFDALFDRIDVLLTPATAAMPWPATETYPPVIAGQPVGPRGHAVFTPFGNALGLPSISVPCRSWPSHSPIGFQLCAAPGQDAALLGLAQEYEKKAATAFRWPPL